MSGGEAVKVTSRSEIDFVISLRNLHADCFFFFTFLSVLLGTLFPLLEKQTNKILCIVYDAKMFHFGRGCGKKTGSIFTIFTIRSVVTI